MIVSATPRLKSILYDTRNLARTHWTGIATYTQELAQVASALGYSVDALVAMKRPTAPADPALAMAQLAIASSDFTPSDTLRHVLTWAFGRPLGAHASQVETALLPPGPFAASLSSFKQMFAVPRIFDVADMHFARHGKLLVVRVPQPPQIFHSTSPMPLRVKGTANIYTIHDLVPILFHNMSVVNKEGFLRMLREVVRTADHIVTVSEHSRADIIRHLGVDERRITNTYQCMRLDSKYWRSPEAITSVDECLGRYELDYQKYFVFVGTIEPKKNITKLIEGYWRAKCRFPLVIIGTDGWLFDDDIRAINDERFLRFELVDGSFVPRRKVRRFPYLPREDVLRIIRGARALVFPSLYEGFGLPVLEAMQLGVPVVTSKVASLKEIAADAALLVDPSDPTDIGKAIRQLEADSDLCAALAQKGLRRAEYFTPAKYAERIGGVYEALS